MYTCLQQCASCNIYVTQMDAWSLNYSGSGKPQVTTLGTAGTYFQHRSPRRERSRLPAAVAVFSMLGALYNLNANSPRMRWHFAFHPEADERSTWACKTETGSLAHPAQREL